MQFTVKPKAAKLTNFCTKSLYFYSFFGSKHRLWVHVRNTDEAVLKSTHNVCFGAKI